MEHSVPEGLGLDPDVPRQPLAFEPGTREQYSNGGYVLLGAIVERASGRNTCAATSTYRWK
jgi:CubicO group peptidase (beta-lactamase class C family)